MANAEKSSRSEESRPKKDLINSAAQAVATVPHAIQISTQIAMQQQSGPFPPPEILQKYDQIHPGLASQIITMANEETVHRRKMEAEVLAIQKRDQVSYRFSELVGQCFGLIIGLAAIGGSVYEAAHGAQVAASFLGTAGLTGLVTAFIMGRQTLVKLKEQDLKHQHDAQQQVTSQQPRK